MLRSSLMLAALPAIVFAIAGTSKPQPIVPVSVPTEGITARRADENTFSRRWHPIYAMPPATEVHYARERVVDAVFGAAKIAPQPVPPSRHRLRTRSVKLDICRAHNMRRVEIRRGRWTGWRCRR